ncbi:MAG: DUF4190 domain-containing protein [Planctomycetota bacterium]|nr:MAG: DUF4190 domain-containing protein [Planctomycetota bacterium]
MDQNPYQSAPEFGDADPYQPPERTSVLAVVSLICAIPCCVPGAGLLATILGGVSLRLIGASQGRISGKPAAIVAIFLGIFVTVVQVAIGYGIAQGYTFYRKQMEPVAHTTFIALSQRDTAGVRAALTPDANADLTDERIASFAEAYEAAAGKATGATGDLRQIIESFGQVFAGSRRNINAGHSGPSDIAPIPFRIDTDRGSFIGVVVFDGPSLGTGPLKVVDLMALLPGARAVTLRDDGPAEREAAAAYGATVISHQEAIRDAAGEHAPAPPDAAPDTPSPAAAPDETPAPA